MEEIEEMKVGSRVKIHARGVVSITSSDATKLSLVLLSGFATLTALAAGSAWLLVVFDDGAYQVHQMMIVAS